jgi:sugar phosphate isomerase/epimerase
MIRAVSCWANEATLRQAVALAEAWGLEAVEGPPDPFEASALHQSGLAFIAQIATACQPGSNLAPAVFSPDLHLEDLKRKLDTALHLDPILINAVGGSDAWDFSMTCRFIEGFLRVGEGLPCPLLLETHRGSAAYSPWRTSRLLEEFPELRLTLDVSHWCVVCERLILDEPGPWRDPILRGVRHIHARVGYAQGPQTPDPRAAVAAAAVASHLRWWGEIWRLNRAAGTPWLSFTPEFGPDSYLLRNPHSIQPAPSSRTLNHWMAERLASDPGFTRPQAAGALVS